MTFSQLSDRYPNPSRPERRLDLRFNSPAQLAVVSVVMWLAGVFIHPLAILVPLGVALLLVAGLAYLLRPKSHTMYWRGRRIDLDDAPSTQKQLYHLLFKR